MDHFQKTLQEKSSLILISIYSPPSKILVNNEI
jgi:hypothetical protein